MTLKDKTLFISGGSRGIGLEIALRAARDGANVALIAKTGEPHPHLPGTVFTAAEEIEAAGGHALPIVGDIRDESQVESAVAVAVERFGGIDVCVNNASAINLSGSEALEMKRYDLMQDINTRGTFVVSRACIPHLRRAENPHILTLSPPISLEPRWLGPHVAYRWPEIQYAHPLDGGGGAAAYRSVEDTAAGLGRDGGRWRAVFGPLAARFGDITADFLRPMLRVPSHPLALTRFGALSALPAAVLDRLWSSEEGRALFAGVAAHAFRPFSSPRVGPWRSAARWSRCWRSSGAGARPASGSARWTSSARRTSSCSTSPRRPPRGSPATGCRGGSRGR
jgi:hypothetical protein